MGSDEVDCVSTPSKKYFFVFAIGAAFDGIYFRTVNGAQLITYQRL